MQISSGKYRYLEKTKEQTNHKLATLINSANTCTHDLGSSPYMSSSFHNSFGSSHLSSVTLWMAEVLVSTMIIEACQNFGHHSQPWHVILQMLFFIRKIKQMTFIYIFFFSKNVRRLFWQGRRSFLDFMVRCIRSRNGGNFTLRCARVRSFNC